MSTNITSLPNNISIGYPESFECMICLEQLTDSLSANVNLANVRDFSLCCEIACLHVFHRSCLEQWFSLDKRYCPCCNEQDIIIDSVRPVPFRTETEYTALVRKNFDENKQLRTDMPGLGPARNSYEYTFDNNFRITRNDDSLEESYLISIILNELKVELCIHNRGNYDSFANQDDMDAHFREGEILCHYINILENLYNVIV